MKVEGTNRQCCNCFHVVHVTFISIFLVLVILLPILYTKTGTPPFWAIWVILGVLLLLYVIYWMIILVYTKSSKKAATTLDNVNSNTTQDHVLSMPYEEETLGLQNSISTMQTEEDDVETLETNYNPSTVGIPPSSFLAPTINQQASIRSSSLDYTPPPPAYQDMIYPPSYRSTNSTKDDNMSIIQSINNSTNNNM